MLSIYESTRKLNQINYDLIFKEIIQEIKKKFGFDLTYMGYKLSEEPICKDGNPCNEISKEEFGGSWAKNKTIYINSNPKIVIKHYLGIENPSEKEIINFEKMIIAHELSHEIYINLASDRFKKEIISTAKKKKFNTEYLKTVSSHKYNEECFCEYMSKLILDSQR